MANLTSSAVDSVLTLPDGGTFLLIQPYAGGEAKGVLILAVVSCISAAAVAGLLLAIAVSAYNTRKLPSSNLFVRSHVAAYFVSMLLCEIVQTIGSIMNIRWYYQMAVTYEPYCTVQGVLKHLSDVGSAYWSLIIAMNTFWILFLRWRLRPYVLIGALVIGWAGIGAIVSAGPTAVQTAGKGPFYGISGYWCWIQGEYPSERITLDYMIMFMSAFLSLVMYVLIFLRLRGNIVLHGWRVSFRFRPKASEPAPTSVDTHVINVAKKMLLYPVAYTILLVPIAICRFTEATGHEVPFAMTIVSYVLPLSVLSQSLTSMTSDSIFLLSGFVNVVLFLTTRRVLPAYSIFPRTISRFFYSSAAEGPRSSAYSTSSAFADVEKIAYDVSVLTRTDSNSSRVLSPPAASAVYPASHRYPPGKAAAQGYDEVVALDSAAWRDEVSSSGPYRSPWVSPGPPNSVPMTIIIPSSASKLPEDRHLDEPEQRRSDRK
ncbi:hypothetical protein BV20DRAFT_1001359 [Pilatotrama ljubarskyi]|nr:hypothetical protein BV20DRAFT_1001359 [Pilatotrama ljubarskyi]